MALTTVPVSFPTRASRSAFVSERFAAYLKESVLDVGCYEAPLRRLLTGVAYTGVDMAGDPDVTLNLDDVQRLPFDDNAFRCVICIDVLEHLDNLHGILDELVRVAKQYVIISLPNCWCDARQPIGRGRGHFGHYGLPVLPPSDRHRWFFSMTEAMAFVEGTVARLGLTLAEQFVTEKPRPWLVRLVRRARYPGLRYHNRYSATLWAVLEKPAPRP